MRGSRSCSDGRLLRWLSMLRSCVLVTTVAWVVVVVPLAHGLVTPCRALLYSGTTTMTRWQQPQPQQQSSSGHWWHPRRSSLGLNSRNSRRKTPATATPLSMHMGHSHSHHHDHHPNERNGAVGLELRSPSPTARVAWFGKKRRLAGMLLFCALAILGPPLLYYRRVVTTSDVAAFVGTATCVAAAEPLRNFIQLWIQRLRNLGQGISKHSTPITASYLFQNKNAADRITLLGYVLYSMYIRIYVLLRDECWDFELVCLWI